MFFSPLKTRFVARLLTGALVWCGLQSGIAQASFIPTQALSAAQIEAQNSPRSQLMQALAREDVQSQLQALGVSPAQAEARIAALTDAEVRTLEKQMADLPAGGDALGIIVLVFLVLILTDLLGATDVFPAIHPAR